MDTLLLEASDDVGGRVRTDVVDVRAPRRRRARPLTVCVARGSRGAGLRPACLPAQGFLLDRGFQIFLTSYPEARAALDYDSLSLRPFYAGALVRHAGDWHRVADPARHPLDALATLLPDNPVGDVADKLRVGLLRCGGTMMPARRCAALCDSDKTLARVRQRAEPADVAIRLPDGAGAERQVALAAGLARRARFQPGVASLFA